jgi:CRISPR-associated protein Cse1 (CRISPR_cse1)
MSRHRYPLTTSEWIPVTDLNTGACREVGITEALTRAHELAPSYVVGNQASVVLLRLLVAVYAAACGPATTAEWDAAWRALTLDPDGRITDYLRTWEHRFDLYDPERPFAQCGHLTEFRRTPDVLDPAYLGGDSGAWFNSRLRDPENYPPHPPAQAARYLLILLGYDVAGIKGAPGHNQRTYGAQVGLVADATQLQLLGATLKDTLLLNLPPAPRAPGDAPSWERDCPPPGVRVRRPTGRLDLLTWPSRRIGLHVNDEGRVDAVAWHDGDRVEGSWATMAEFDAMSVWHTTSKGQVAPVRQVVDEEFGAPLPWTIARTLPTSDGTLETRWSSGVIAHLVAAGHRGAVSDDYRPRVVVSRTLWTNQHRTIIKGLAAGEIPLRPLRLLTTPAMAQALSRFDYYASVVLLARLRRAVTEARPDAAELAARVALDPGIVDRAWSRLLADLAALPAEPTDEQFAAVLGPFRAALVNAAHLCLDRLPLPLFERAKVGALLPDNPAAASEGTWQRLSRPAAPEGGPATNAAAPGGRSGARGGRPSPEVTIDGETKTLADWARDPRCRVTVLALRQRLNAGWDPMTALTTPAKRGPKTDPPP